jgi:nucleoside phosphorylase
MKEYSLDDFWDKKERQYGPFRRKYKGLFDPRNHRLLRGASHAIIPRNSSIGSSILTGWEEAPDSNPIWRERILDLNSAAVERVRAIPREIVDEGIAITWAAIQSRIAAPTEIRKFRPVLQNVYFSAYLKEYKLKVITSLPYASHSFVLVGRNLAYDYEALKAALDALSVWEIVRAISAGGMIHLRQRGGYIQFREAFDTIAKGSDHVAEVRKIFTLAAEARKPSATFRSVINKNSHKVVPLAGGELTESEIAEIASRLASVARTALEIAHDTKPQKPRAEVGGKRKKVSNATPKYIAIFVALEMERKILVERWGLKGAGLEQVWRGELGNAQISVFGRDEMGRVPAAVATMQFLCRSKPKPDFLLVAGIAAGFEREKVFVGDLLIPTRIVDLASRKRYIEPEFRPREFATDDRLPKYLRASFNVSEWEVKVIKALDWPESRRPALRYGTMVSLDEVVANTGYVDELCRYWPKLLGLEMESGGVCAAADTFGIKPAVIRGVSDLADPSKSDNEWRLRAMKTVAHLIENVDFNALLP